MRSLRESPEPTEVTRVGQNSSSSGALLGRNALEKGDRITIQIEDREVFNAP